VSAPWPSNEGRELVHAPDALVAHEAVIRFRDVRRTTLAVPLIL